MSYAVYEVTITGTCPHSSIYVETGEGGVGEMFHVRAAVSSSAMIFDKKSFYGPGPESLPTFDSKVQHGTIKPEDLDRFGTVVEGVTPPAQQYAGEGIVGVCQCIIWTSEALDAARADGVLS